LHFAEVVRAMPFLNRIISASVFGFPHEAVNCTWNVLAQTDDLLESLPMQVSSSAVSGFSASQMVVDGCC